jgi:hypothetical protein
MDPEKRLSDRRRESPIRLSLPAALLFLLPVQLAWQAPAWALSEIGSETPGSPAEADEGGNPEGGTLTLPGPAETRPAAEENPAGDDPMRPDVEPDGPLPEVIYNLDRLPEPARRMHRLILEATKSGDIEKLRPLIGTGDGATQLSFGGVDGDPVDFLRELSGDTEGHEILAILEEVLSAGYVHVDAGTPSELYVWPYFFAIPLDRLTNPQRVELFKIVTAGDFEDMKAFGSYIFYRVGIDPEGHWAFFVAGD